MTGAPEGNSRCPLCGGHLRPGMSTVPFVFPDTIVVIKDVPAEVCSSCHEPFAAGKVTDRLTELLNQLRAFRTEVSIISYPDIHSVPATTGGGNL
jgi:YgiT-type zinc finger domain-containing protein